MQGFNKYYPPDYDGEKHGSLNSYRGKHALGDRARKIDQGILITRFELPFNIWCGTCNNHIGMGVRYNAEKRKIGMYFTTPIFAFRCKCHLCDGWFEIRTDPQNTRYIVESGARKQEVEWDPEENGGFAVHDTNAAEVAGAVDPLVALEKTTDALKRQDEIGRPRIESLQAVSDRYNTDPYLLSSKARKRFREEKRIDKAIKAKDDEMKERYGLPESLSLARDDPGLDMEAKEEFRQARRKRLLEDNTGSKKRYPASSSKASLSSALLRNTLRKVDPFTNSHDRPLRATGKNLGISIRK